MYLIFNNKKHHQKFKHFYNVFDLHSEEKG